MTDQSKHVAHVYDEISGAYVGRFNEPSDHIDDFLNLLPQGGRILDAGCGPGIDSAYMASRNFEVVSVDISQKMLEEAHQRNPRGTFENVDIRQMHFGPESYNGILSSFSLIHIPKQDVPGVLKNFSNILKSSGLISIAIQEGPSQEIFIPEPFKPDEKLFVNVMSTVELRGLLHKYGFTTVHEFTRPAQKEEFELDFNKFVLIARKAASAS